MQAVETDFAELILQLDGDWSSHILVPAIHRNRAEIRDLFVRTIASGRELSDDPRELAETARVYLRERFLNAKMGVSGANFGVAENGAVVVVESEGNGRMCTTLTPVLVTVPGIEKLVPTFADLEVFFQHRRDRHTRALRRRSGRKAGADPRPRPPHLRRPNRQIVETVPEAFASLRGLERRPLTFVSGPSRHFRHRAQARRGRPRPADARGDHPGRRGLR